MARHFDPILCGRCGCRLGWAYPGDITTCETFCEECAEIIGRELDAAETEADNGDAPEKVAARHPCRGCEHDDPDALSGPTGDCRTCETRINGA